MSLYHVMLITVETMEEVAEETSVYTVDDVYSVLLEISNKLDDLNTLGEALLQFLQSSELASISALLLILVGFELLRLVRGWVKGGR